MAFQNTSLSFRTSDQSLWKPGTAESFRIDTGDYLVFDMGEQTWDLNVDLWAVEASAEAYFDFRFGLVAWANLGSSGSWGAQFELDLEVGLPNAIVVAQQGTTQSFMTFDFSTYEIVSATIESEGFEIGEGGEISAGLDLIVDVSAGFRDIDIDLPWPASDYSRSDWNLINFDETINIITVSQALPVLTLELYDGVELTAQLPSGADTEGASVGQGHVEGAGFSDTDFLALDADLDQLLTGLIEKLGPKGAAAAKALQNTVFLQEEFSIGPIDIEVVAVDISAHLGLFLTEDTRVDIRDQSTIYDPDDPTSGIPDVFIKLTSDNGTPDDLSDDTYQDAKLGDDEVLLEAPHLGSEYGTALVTAEYTIGTAEFHHDVGVGLNAYFAIEVLKFEIDIAGVWDKTWGPLWKYQYPEDPKFKLGDIYSDTFTVDGAIFGTQTDVYDVFYVEQRIAPIGWNPVEPSAEAAVYAFFEANNQQLAALFDTLSETYIDLYGNPAFELERPETGTFPQIVNGIPTDNFTSTDPDGKNPLNQSVHYVWTGNFSTNVILPHANTSRVTVATPTSSTGYAAPDDVLLYGKLLVKFDNSIYTFSNDNSLLGFETALSASVGATEITYTYRHRNPDPDKYLTTSNVTNVVGGEGADVLVYFFDQTSGDTRGGEYFDGGDNVFKAGGLYLENPDGTHSVINPPVLVEDVKVGDTFIADLSHFTTAIRIDLAESVRLENDNNSTTIGGFVINTLDADGQTVEEETGNRIIVSNVEALVLETGSGDDYLVGGTFSDIFKTGDGDDIVRLVKSFELAGVSEADTFYDVEDDLVELGNGDDVAIIEMSNTPVAHTRQFTDYVYGGYGEDHLFVEAGNQGLRYDVNFNGEFGVDYLYRGNGIGALNAHSEFALLLNAIEQVRGDLWYEYEDYSKYQAAHNSVSGNQHVALLNGVGNGGKIEITRDLEKVSIIPDAENTQGMGDDLLVFMGGSRYNGGAGGTDTFIADFMDGYSYQSLGGTGDGVNIDLAAERSYFGNTIIENVDRLHVRGTFDFDVIFGGALDDYIDGGDADDVIYGGNDIVADTLLGGSGKDIFYWSNDGDDIIDGGSDTDTLHIRSAEQPYSPTNTNAIGKQAGGHYIAFEDANGNRIGQSTLTAHLTGDQEDLEAFFDLVKTAPKIVSGFRDHHVTYENIERVNVTGSVSSDDILVYQGGNYYSGGNGAADHDVFIADFRGQDAGINFEVRETVSIGGEQGYWLGNQVYIDGIDRGVIFGGSGFDTFSGGKLNDVFYGGLGNDIFFGRGGNDTLGGGDGSDIFFYSDEGYDQIDGGTNAENSYVDGALQQVEFEQDHLFIMESSGPLRVAIMDENGDDILSSDRGLAFTYSTNDVLHEMALNSLTAASWAYYTANSNNLNSRSLRHVDYKNMEAVDIAGSHEYDDLIVFQNGLGYVGGESDADADLFLADLRGFSDNLTFDAYYQSGDGYDIGQGTKIADFERFYLLLGEGNDEVLGGALDDVVYAGDGNDSLAGGLGDDVLFGEAGNDLFEHTGGNDFVDGGEGAGDVLLIGGTDDPFTVSIFDTDGTQLGTELSAIDGTPTTSDLTTFYGFTTEGSVVVSHGDNEVRFQNVEEVLMSGSEANDVLVGGTAQGVLFGGGGDDVLLGRGGNDFMSGGTGSDTYVFGANFGSDIIYGENTDSSTLIFTANAAAAFSYAADGIDLVMTQGANTLRIADYFAANARYGLNFTFVFTDGTEKQDFQSLGVVNTAAPVVGQTYLGDANNGDGGGDRPSRFDGTADNDTHRGFGGDDKFYSSVGADLYDGGAGNDQVDYSNSTAPVNIDLSGFKGESGNAEGDLLVSIEAIKGTSGNDTIAGNQFDNALSGEAGNDSLIGRGGDDILSGNDGNDTVEGGDGSDTALGGKGNDILSGGNGKDILSGGDGNDTLFGGAEADLLGDGLGDDVVRGGAGDDTFIYIGGRDTWDGQWGKDLADFELFEHAITFDLTSSDHFVVTRDGDDMDEATGPERVLVEATNIENIRGSFYSDVLVGDSGVNQIDGSLGDDRITGNAGNDSLRGGAGIDILDYSKETGTLGAQVWLDAGVGEEEYAYDTFGDRDVVSGFEVIIGTDRVDNILGNSAANTIFGGLGDDYYLDGYSGNDLVFGQGGNDLIYGGTGDDRLSGGDGDDTVNGDAGNDVFIGGATDSAIAVNSSGGGTDTFDGGTGFDTASYSTTLDGINVDLRLSSGQVTGTEVGTDTLINIDNIVGGLGDDTMTGNGSGNSFSYFGGFDTYFGGAGGDVVSFTEFGHAVLINLAATIQAKTTDRGDVVTGELRDLARFTSIEGVIGTIFNDSLTGDAQANTLLGGKGDDVLFGGNSTNEAADTDMLAGGEGDDRFIAAPGDGADTIDGGAGVDTLDYSAQTNGVTASLRFGDGDDSITGVERLVGTAFADGLTGDEAGNILDAGLGDDTIDGGFGDDLIIYSGGLDQILGGNGSDALDFTQFASGVEADLAKTDDAVFTRDTADWDVGTQRVIVSLPASDIENLIGTGFNDKLLGNADANMFNGGLGDDLIFGRAGDDTFAYSGGFDIWQGGAGIDTANFATYRFAVAVDLATTNVQARTQNTANVTGTAWTNIVRISSVENLIGTLFDDVLRGTSVANILVGLAGNDELSGGAGVDELQGGGGDDTLIGGAGADSLSGGEGIDTADYSASTAGVTIDLEAGTGFGGEAEGDTLSDIEDVIGTSAADTLIGARSANILSGGNGADTVMGGSGDDTLIGGAGADSLVGGAGLDIASYLDSATGVTIDLSSGSAAGGDAQGDTLTGIEGIVGSNGADSLTGSTANDVFWGNAGADTISGGAGADYLQGDGGADLLSGGDGNDLLLGGNENDTLLGGNDDDTLDGGADDDSLDGGMGNDTLNGGFGNDTLLGQLGNDTLDGGLGNDLLEGGSGFDVLYGWKGDDTLVGALDDDTLYGQNGNDLISGGNQRDLLEGGAGSDTLLGGNHGDTLNGGLGDDTIEGQFGFDVMNGGDGDDWMHGGSMADQIMGDAGDDYINGGAGPDSIWLGEGDDFFRGFFQWGTLGRDTVWGGTGDDTISASAGNDEVHGEAGHDLVSGGFGADLVTGGQGRDTLIGGGGNDRLEGGGWSDRLEGELGADILSGGSGADIFVFKENGGRDTITDFQVNEDHLLFDTANDNTFNDLNLVNSGRGLWIEWSGGSLLLEGLSSSDFDRGDVLFE